MGSVQQVFAGGAAVITGAGSGIGEGLARYAASIGMKVVLADVVVSRIESIAAEIKGAGGDALAVQTDVADFSALDNLAKRAHEKFGNVRILVNNAGIETLGYTWEISPENWEKTLNINIHGVVHGVRAFAPHMIASGEPAYIANVASIGALGMMPIQASYVMSKHAILSFSESLYLEMQLKKVPIRVSAVLPGPVATRIFTDSDGVVDPLISHHRESMRRLLEESGITPIEAAQRIFTQIAADKFWVSTHPDLTQAMASARATHLSNLQFPELPEQARASVELS